MGPPLTLLLCTRPILTPPNPTLDAPQKPPPIIAEMEEGTRFGDVGFDDIPLSKKAMVLRKEPGDTAEDGTVNEKGQRLFFAQNHLRNAMIEKTVNKLKNRVLAKIVAHNVLERFGLRADIDGDGEITNAEILALSASGRHNGNAIMQMTMALANKAEAISQVDKLEDGLGAGFGMLRNSVANVGDQLGPDGLKDLGKGLKNMGKRTHRLTTGAGVAAVVAAKK